MEYAFTLNVLPVVGGVVIVLVLVLCELGSTGFGGGLPSGGYRYYIGEHTVLYLRQSGSCATLTQASSSGCGPALRRKPK